MSFFELTSKDSEANQFDIADTRINLDRVGADKKRLSHHDTRRSAYDHASHTN